MTTMITCAFENGNPGELRHVTVDTLVVRDNQILLVKRAARFVEGGKWALPGGYVDRDETVTQAAKREVLEETGWRTATITLLAIRDDPDTPGDDRQNISFMYFATVSEKTGDADNESEDVQWFPLDKLPSSMQIAFDHQEIIDLYKQYLLEKFTLPVFN